MMMKTAAIIASLIASAAAFAPAAQTSTSTSTSSSASSRLSAKADYANEIGVVAPLGVFDPMAKLDKVDRAEFDRLRALEIKHGRVAMLGVVGYLTTYAGVRLPGLEDVPCGFAAFEGLPNEVKIQMGATLIFMEIANRDQTGGNAAFPGDFRNGYLDFGWDDQSAAWQTSKRNIELNNGRAAQMGILGLVTHELMGNVGDVLP